MQQRKGEITKENAIKRKWLSFLDWVLPVYLFCTLPMFYFGLHYDFVFKGLTIFATLFFLARFGYHRTQATAVFTVFLLIVSFSFIQYFYNDVPVVCFFSEASNYIAAMLFFYVGVSDDRQERHFYNVMLYAIVIVFVIGLLCYVITPSWYISRYVEIISERSMLDYNDTNILNDLRFSAFFGDSYPVSHLSVFAAAIATFQIGNSKGRQKMIPIVLLIIAIISSIASMHRASILGCVICIIMFVYFNYKNHQNKTNIVIFTLGLLVLLVFLFFMPSMNERVSGIFEMVTERVDDNMELGKALDERKNTHELMASMRFFIFGHGLGSGGASARMQGLLGISDMQYLKMFFENGIVGAILFIMVIIHALSRGIKYIKYYLTEVSIILFILVAMLGSNSLSIYYFIVYPFWYAVGRIYNTNYLQKVKNKEWIF